MTILNWSFPRKDITRKAQSYQLALALRKEVAALEEAGCKVIQVPPTVLLQTPFYLLSSFHIAFSVLPEFNRAAPAGEERSLQRDVGASSYAM